MWAVVVNPISGSGKGAKVGREVTGYFASKKESYQVITATNAEKLQANLSTFLERYGHECRGVICVGGDGLVHLTLQLVVPRNIAFAVVPAGTGNDFARSLNSQSVDLQQYLDHVTSEQPTAIDLGLVDSEWFGAILSTGFDSVVNERANSMKRPKGPMKYNFAIALELPKFRPLRYQITLDSRVIETEAMLIAVGNGNSYGGGMKVCPDADMTDGLFDVMILRPVSKIEFLKVFPKVFSGEHIQHPSVEIHRTSRVFLDAPAVAYADGERIGGLPVRAECIAGAGLSWPL